ncbi:MAG: O-methyltransferase [Terracidiphilus sp.]
MERNLPLEKWIEVDRYINNHLVPSDPALGAAVAANAAAELPAIDVTPNQGKLLYMLARLAGARRILEIGTLGGYSTIWLARALPADGRLITLELLPKHAEIAQVNIARAGVAHLVEIRVGRALDLLEKLDREGAEPFDLIFIDADKSNGPGYLAWAVRHARPGSLVIVDNVVRDGEIVNAESSDADIQGSRRVFEMLAAEPRLIATALQTVGSKGYDGLAIALLAG